MRRVAWLWLALGLTGLWACKEDAPVDDGGSNNADNNGNNGNNAPNNGNNADNNAPNNANNADNNAPNNANNAPNNAGNNQGAPCQDNVDCRGGEVCREGACREACSEADPCTVGVCDGGVCVGCLEDADCGADEACREGACAFFCRSDAACPDGQACDEATGACREAECQGDGDCRGGFTCREGLCAPIDPLVCEPDQRRCEGISTLWTCNGDGTREEQAACQAPARCVEGEDGQARCAQVVCEPFGIGCLDGATAYACNGDGTEQTPLPCRQGQRCEDGACVAQVCAPGTVRCEGEALLTCDEDGAREEITPCESLPACQGELGCFCGEGACEPRICAPGSGRCVGNSAQRCDEDGGAWSPLEACDEGEECLEGVCLSQVCTPGEKVCAGDTLLTCNAQGDDRTERDCAASDQACVGTGANARCAALVCEAGEVSCAGRAVRARCNADGTASTNEACPNGQVCVEAIPGQATCLAEVCDPDSSGCLDADTAYDCDATGTALERRECTQGQRCTGRGVCQSQTCVPNEVTCLDAQTVATCNAQGTGYAATQPCEGSCEDGACMSDCTTAAEEGSNLGCEFWTVDLENIESDANGIALERGHGVRLVNPDPSQSATVTISRAGTNEATYTLSPGEVYEHEFSAGFEANITGKHSQAAWQLTSTRPILAAQFNALLPLDALFTVDASLLWPTHALGREYRAASWPTRSQTDNNVTTTLNGFVTVVATQPGTTTVTITSPVAILPGTQTPAFAVNTPQSVTLTRGQLLHLGADRADADDLTGLRVQANQDVAVFSGHECANVPDDTTGYCDHLEEQLLPVASWGATHFLVPYFKRNASDQTWYSAIIGSDGTTLDATPNHASISESATYDAGEVVLFSGGAPLRLVSSRPIQVAQLMQGSAYTGSVVDPRCEIQEIFNVREQGVGDPSMAMVPPTEHWRRAYTVSNPEGYVDHYALLIAPVGAQVTGNNIPVTSWTTIQGTGYAYGHLPAPATRYTLAGDVPFGVVLYGYGCGGSYALQAGGLVGP